MEAELRRMLADNAEPQRLTKTILVLTGGCEVVAIFVICSVFQSITSKRKPLSIKTWKFHLRQIIRTGGGVKCEVIFGLLVLGRPILAIGSILNRECGKDLEQMASATDTKTDTKFGAPNQFGITGGNSPTARSRGRVSFIYLRGCVKDRMKTRYRLIRRGVRNGAFYCVDTKTGKRTSLQTCNEDEARQIINAKNQALRQPVLNMQIAKAYLYGTDNGIATRTTESEASLKEFQV
jgi:hypothetical protein